MLCAADVPRSRLVKYPLLLKQVVKYSDDTDDIRLLQAAITSLEKVSLRSLSRFLLLWNFWSISELWIRIHVETGYSISSESPDLDPIRIQGLTRTEDKKIQLQSLKKIFFDQKFKFTYVQAIRRSLQPSKENIQHFKKWNLWLFLVFSKFVSNFYPPGSGSGSRIRIRIRIQGPIESGFGSDPDPQHWSISIGPIFWFLNPSYDSLIVSL